METQIDTSVRVLCFRVKPIRERGGGDDEELGERKD